MLARQEVLRAVSVLRGSACLGPLHPSPHRLAAAWPDGVDIGGRAAIAGCHGSHLFAGLDPFADPVVLLASDPGHSALPVRTKRELSLAHPPPVEEDSNLHRGRSSNPDRGVAIGRGRASSSGRLQGLIPVSVVVCGLWRVVARQFVLRKRRPNLTRALFLQIFAVDQAR